MAHYIGNAFLISLDWLRSALKHTDWLIHYWILHRFYIDSHQGFVGNISTTSHWLIASSIYVFGCEYSLYWFYYPPLITTPVVVIQHSWYSPVPVPLPEVGIVLWVFVATVHAVVSDLCQFFELHDCYPFILVIINSWNIISIICFVSVQIVL